MLGRNHIPLGDIWKTFCAKLREHVQFYGVSFNFKMVSKFLYEAKKIIFKWLNRRSQRQSFDWIKIRPVRKETSTANCEDSTSIVLTDQGYTCNDCLEPIA